MTNGGPLPKALGAAIGKEALALLPDILDAISRAIRDPGADRQVLDGLKFDAYSASDADGRRVLTRCSIEIPVPVKLIGQPIPEALA